MSEAQGSQDGTAKRRAVTRGAAELRGMLSDRERADSPTRCPTCLITIRLGDGAGASGMRYCPGCYEPLGINLETSEKAEPWRPGAIQESLDDRVELDLARFEAGEMLGGRYRPLVASARARRGGLLTALDIVSGLEVDLRVFSVPTLATGRRVLERMLALRYLPGVPLLRLDDCRVMDGHLVLASPRKDFQMQPLPIRIGEGLTARARYRILGKLAAALEELDSRGLVLGGIRASDLLVDLDGELLIDHLPRVAGEELPESVTGTWRLPDARGAIAASPSTRDVVCAIGIARWALASASGLAETDLAARALAEELGLLRIDDPQSARLALGSLRRGIERLERGLRRTTKSGALLASTPTPVASQQVVAPETGGGTTTGSWRPTHDHEIGMWSSGRFRRHQGDFLEGLEAFSKENMPRGEEAPPILHAVTWGVTVLPTCVYLALRGVS